MNSYVQFVMIILFTDDVLSKIYCSCFDGMNTMKKDKHVILMALLIILANVKHYCRLWKSGWLHALL